MRKAWWEPAKPGQILTDAEKYGRMLDAVKQVKFLAGLGPNFYNHPFVKEAVREAKRIEEEKIRERIVCGGNRLS